jgi:hypothetical protein
MDSPPVRALTWPPFCDVPIIVYTQVIEQYAANMTVPKGRFAAAAGGASLARIAFQDASDDIRSYFALAQMLKDRKGGQKHLSNVGRGTIILVSALWETYCEAVALEASMKLLSGAGSPDDLPVALLRRIASEVRDDKHELSPWTLAGDGWKSVAADRIPQIIRNTTFNTPKPDQMDQLFERAIGIRDLSRAWTPIVVSNPADVRATLKEFVELRGAIAHGERPEIVSVKGRISDFYQLVSHLTVQTDVLLADFLESHTGVRPW